MSVKNKYIIRKATDIIKCCTFNLFISFVFPLLYLSSQFIMNVLVLMTLKSRFVQTQ